MFRLLRPETALAAILAAIPLASLCAAAELDSAARPVVAEKPRAGDTSQPKPKPNAPAKIDSAPDVAEEAIDKARMSVPDLMLVDIMLPDKEGSDLVKVLRQDPKTDSIPAIFFSGIVTRDKSEEAATEITVGDRAYKALSKPFSSVELMTEVRKVIG